MIELSGKPGELRFCIEVKRAATGEVEKYELIGKIGEEVEFIEKNHSEKNERAESR